jgi:Phosphatidyl serine synthase
VAYDSAQQALRTLHGNALIHVSSTATCKHVMPGSMALWLRGHTPSARSLQHLFPELGQDLQERAYGSDCRLYIPEEKRVNWEVIKGTVFDEFVIAHTVGWWCAFLMMQPLSHFTMQGSLLRFNCQSALAAVATC